MRECAKRYPTAIISGRSRHKVSQFIKLQELYYAGSHGLDIVGPTTTMDGNRWRKSWRTNPRSGRET